MQKLKRGEKGFIDYRKKKYVGQIFLSIGTGLAVFILGLLLNKMETTNIFTVLSFLMVLPMARAVVGVVVLFPYHGVTEEAYNLVKSHQKQGMNLYTDVVMTSPDKVMNLDFLVEWEGNVIGLLGKMNQDISYIQSYLTKGVRNWCAVYRVKIYDKPEQFLKALDRLEKKEVKEEEAVKVTDYLRSLMVE